MITERLHKEKMTKKEALEEIKSKAESQFDSNITKLFIELMEDTKVFKLLNKKV